MIFKLYFKDINSFLKIYWSTLIITSALRWGYVIVAVCPPISLFVSEQRNSKTYGFS